MSIFDLHAQALEDYRDFVGSFVNVADERLRGLVRRLLEEEQRLWPEPLVQLSPAYRRDATVEELAREGLLHPETARIFRQRDGRTYRLYRHQVEAIRLAAAGRSFVLTSGTGSGKTFCYFIPIVDAVVRRPGIQAGGLRGVHHERPGELAATGAVAAGGGLPAAHRPGAPRALCRATPGRREEKSGRTSSGTRRTSCSPTMSWPS